MIAMPSSEWAFASNLSSALTYHAAQPSHLELLASDFARGVKCSASNDEATVQITFDSMLGLFIACSILVALSLFVAGYKRCHVQNSACSFMTR